MSPNSFATFAGRNYLNLETLKRSGDAVRTPVWFAAAPMPGNATPRTLYIYTLENTGKIKRIRNNPRVRIAPCDARGNLKGEWVEARARLLSGDDADRANRILTQKYLLKRIFDFLSFFRVTKRSLIALDAV
jgi:PPOX class probable F420-dependent enzyme